MSHASIPWAVPDVTPEILEALGLPLCKPCSATISDVFVPVCWLPDPVKTTVYGTVNFQGPETGGFACDKMIEDPQTIRAWSSSVNDALSLRNERPEAKGMDHLQMPAQRRQEASLEVAKQIAKKVKEAPDYPTEVAFGAAVQKKSKKWDSDPISQISGFADKMSIWRCMECGLEPWEKCKRCKRMMNEEDRESSLKLEASDTSAGFVKDLAGQGGGESKHKTCKEVLPPACDATRDNNGQQEKKCSAQGLKAFQDNLPIPFLGWTPQHAIGTSLSLPPEVVKTVCKADIPVCVPCKVKLTMKTPPDCLSFSGSDSFRADMVLEMELTEQQKGGLSCLKTLNLLERNPWDRQPSLPEGFDNGFIDDETRKLISLVPQGVISSCASTSPPSDLCENVPSPVPDYFHKDSDLLFGIRDDNWTPTAGTPTTKKVDVKIAVTDQGRMQQVMETSSLFSTVQPCADCFIVSCNLQTPLCASASGNTVNWKVNFKTEAKGGKSCGTVVGAMGLDKLLLRCGASESGVKKLLVDASDPDAQNVGTGLKQKITPPQASFPSSDTPQDHSIDVSLPGLTQSVLADLFGVSECRDCKVEIEIPEMPPCIPGRAAPDKVRMIAKKQGGQAGGKSCKDLLQGNFDQIEQTPETPHPWRDKVRDAFLQRREKIPETFRITNIPQTIQDVTVELLRLVVEDAANVETAGKDDLVDSYKGEKLLQEVRALEPRDCVFCKVAVDDNCKTCKSAITSMLTSSVRLKYEMVHGTKYRTCMQAVQMEATIPDAYRLRLSQTVHRASAADEWAGWRPADGFGPLREQPSLSETDVGYFCREDSLQTCEACEVKVKFLPPPCKPTRENARGTGTWEIQLKAGEAGGRPCSDVVSETIFRGTQGVDAIRARVFGHEGSNVLQECLLKLSEQRGASLPDGCALNDPSTSSPHLGRWLIVELEADATRPTVPVTLTLGPFPLTGKEILTEIEAGGLTGLSDCPDCNVETCTPSSPCIRADDNTELSFNIKFKEGNDGAAYCSEMVERDDIDISDIIKKCAGSAPSDLKTKVTKSPHKDFVEELKGQILSELQKVPSPARDSDHAVDVKVLPVKKETITMLQLGLADCQKCVVDCTSVANLPTCWDPTTTDADAEVKVKVTNKGEDGGPSCVKTVLDMGSTGQSCLQKMGDMGGKPAEWKKENALALLEKVQAVMRATTDFAQDQEFTFTGPLKKSVEFRDEMDLEPCDPCQIAGTLSTPTCPPCQPSGGSNQGSLPTLTLTFTVSARANCWEVFEEQMRKGRDADYLIDGVKCDKDKYGCDKALQKLQSKEGTLQAQLEGLTTGGTNTKVFTLEPGDVCNDVGRPCG
eukprot:Cvel_16381.t1-p1 / transcript=Cvel_16381.t1 / gene=Cvel_16381 / organism=Chromera_velia_CCMP2878 / gene_product=hypothetical protein / transcript_product=hypothetical protein / location=Cvel_scaffold1260:1236-10188(-) / protein_length=1342 / sequence_SO=supercontig / SO=protein_coding / is_pseudo=false